MVISGEISTKELSNPNTGHPMSFGHRECQAAIGTQLAGSCAK